MAIPEVGEENGIIIAVGLEAYNFSNCRNFIECSIFSIVK